MKRTVLYVALVIAASVAALPASGQGLGQGTAGVVKARGYTSVDGVRPGDKFRVAVEIEIAEGYHINAHKPTLEYLRATTVTFQPPEGLGVEQSKYPAPVKRKFQFEDAELDVHEGIVYITADARAGDSLRPGRVNIPAAVTVQACNDNLCLAPSTLNIEVPVQVVAAGQIVKEANPEIFAKAAAAPALVEFRSNKIADLLAESGLLITLGSIFLGGLLLNLTPCVYPIIPITIGFFVNQSASVEGAPRLRRTFLMASMYVLGLALTYSVLGVVASMSGGLFGGALQNPLVLIVLAGMMIALALSMFGVYEFKMPDALNRLATSSTTSTSGSLGALLMGLTMGIVAAPCIGPFVLALLVFVGEKGDPMFGFLLFFVLALGLGIPYLFLGTFSGAIKALPRSGMWMVTVRKVFGLVLIGMAIYFVSPLLGDASKYVLIAFFALSALYLIFYEAGRAKPAQFAWVLRGLGVVAAALAIWWAMPRPEGAEIQWRPYSEQALAEARAAGMGVIIDAYADWCIPCKELDADTFRDPEVAKDAERFVTLKLDLTSPADGSEASRAANRFRILGVPTIIFMNAEGEEVSDLRLEGFENASGFIARMKRIESLPGSPALAKNDLGASAPVGDGSVGAKPTSGGEPIPALALPLLDGGALDLASFKGKVVLLDFWATWCVPCKAEIKILNKLAAEYKERGLEIVGISYLDEGPEMVKPFVKENPMNYTKALGNPELLGAYKVGDVLPVTIIIDKQGQIRYRHEGLSSSGMSEFESELRGKIEQMLSE
jgi:thiol:disulfide interchange protein DsbD